MKKSIEMPIVNVVRFEAKDVITTSGDIAKGNSRENLMFAEGKARISVSEGKVSDPTRFVW